MKISFFLLFFFFSSLIRALFNRKAEWSPTGRFTREFKKNWGFDFVVYKELTPWSRDITKIYKVLHVVDNNSAENIGGGGQPRAPLAPPFKNNLK